MIVVRVDLDSARGSYDDKHLFTMVIGNDGTGTDACGNYNIYLGRRGQANPFNVIERPLRKGRVENHARKSANVRLLVLKALTAVQL